MPMSPEDLDEMKTLIAAARKRELSFGLCMGKSPEGTVLMMHRMKDPEVLARLAKRDGETAKVAYGQVFVKGKKMMLTCLDEIPAGIAKRTKKFLADQGLKMKVVCLDPSGAVADDDGEEEEVETEDSADAGTAADGPAADTDAEAAPDADWARLVAEFDPRISAFVAAGSEKAAAVGTAWKAALAAADAGRYPEAMTVLNRIRPLLDATPAQEAAGSGQAAAWEQARDATRPMFDAAIATNPANRSQLETVWTTAEAKADAGDHATGLALLSRLKPALEAILNTAAAGSAPSPEQERWEKARDAMMGLYERAMGLNPADRTRLDAIWGMAHDKAELRDFAAALGLLARLKPELDKAIAAGQAGSDQAQIPADVVPFQRARVSWAGARAEMRTEMRRLEEAIVAAVQGEEDGGADVVAEVHSLTGRLSVFDDRLEETLDRITNSRPGDDRDALKKVAIGQIREYADVLKSDPFFAEVDGNPFVSVSVAKTAQEKLREIAAVLR